MRGEALEVVYADIADELVETFCSWQEHDQLPALRSCPGVLAASWLDSLEGEPRLLLVCELENVSVVHPIA